MKRDRLVVAHTIAGMNPSAGGPIRSVAGLCAGLAAAGCETHLFYFAGNDASPSESFELDNVILHPIASFGQGYLRQFFVLQYFRELSKSGRTKPFHAIQDHGIWLPSNLVSAIFASRYRVPRVLSIHGALAPWAINFKGTKKKVAWWLYQSDVIRRASVIRATSLAEYEHVRSLGITTPVAVIPNGVSLPRNLAIHSKRHHPIRTALFLGRIHPVKGLINLIHAWAAVRPANWRLLIVGPVEQGHDDEIKEVSLSLGLNDQVHLMGEIDDKQKWQYLDQANLLVLPSFTENFGMVVVEALAVGIPVLTTRGTPWRELIEEQCGWWVEPTVEGLAGGIRSATNMNEEQLRLMGTRGKRLTERKYLWSSIALQMMELYMWLGTGGDRPEFVKIK